ncbi:MAG: M56 family metallopeptidase [Defluviitaleaceae bacterium]|nr:M56 family metallopeptidase [Defluviitaleaceae bacterium]
MQTFLTTLLICSVTMSAIGLLYKAATPLLARRYAPSGRYYAWLVVVMGLIVPFRPRFGGAIVNVGLPAAVPVSAPVPIPMTQASAFGISTGHLPAHVWQPLENAATAVHINWWQVGFMVWLTGALVFLMLHGVKHYRFIKMTHRWGEAATCPQLLALLQTVAGELGIARLIPLYICPVAGSPMMTGLLRPKMFLPTADMAPDALHFIFKHELIHFRRKDLLYKYAVLLASAMHWFNPLVYRMAQEIKTLCEMSCDAQVVSGTNMDKRQRYSEAMIGVVRYQSRLKTALSTNFDGGKKDMKKRISSIMNANQQLK